MHVVITGASSGIGAALTQALAADGCVLYVCARRADDLPAFGYPCDVSQEEQVAEFVAQIRARTSHVDALINCAGSFGAIGPLLRTDSREWRETIDVNLYGTYLMIKHIAPLMMPERDPCIVNFAGGGALSPFPNYSAYAASKAAVVRLTENLAIELAPIRVNAVAPGFVATGIHEATLRAGRASVGDEYFEHTRRLLREGSVPIEVPVTCVQFLLASELTGKTISASFDPWDTPEFVEAIPRTNRSDLYTMRRVDTPEEARGRLRAMIASSEVTRNLVEAYGWTAATKAYFVDGIASPIETLTHGGVDGILDLMDGDGDGHVLDAGCGIGLVTILARRRGIDAVGVDLDRASLELGRRLGHVVGLTEEELSSSLVVGDVTDLSYPDDYFSMIVSHLVIEHVDDPAEMLHELVRCLRPGGTLCLVGPDNRFSFEAHYRIPWPPFMEKEAAVSWLEAFDKPVEGLSTFNYTSLPHVLRLLAGLDVEVVRTRTTTPEARIEEQRRLLLGDEEQLSDDVDEIKALAMRVRQNDIQTLETSFIIDVRKR